MNYSRRQLEAFGEPFGESATHVKAGGFGRVYGGGGGGGGGSSSGTQTTITELPEWARPVAQKILAKGEALTDITTPAKYKDSRYAGLSDLQKKAIESVSTPESYQKSLQGFMDPYAQNVIDIQKREANRQSQMAGLQEAGAAVKSGAFGGSRAGLVEAERARNTGQLLSDIQQRGSEAAYQNAQQALQRDIANKMQIGSMQQADLQRPLDIAYQDWATEQNFPYKQLGFMSDLLRGTPTGSSSVTNMYQPLSGGQALAGLGMGAYGMSKLFAKDGGLMESSYAEGGMVDGYAKGGMSVAEKFNDPEAMLAEMDNLTDEQLMMIVNSPTTQAEGEAAQRELAMRASERKGLARAFNQMPQEQQQAMVRAAGGGIIAFAKPTEDNNYSLVSSEDDDALEAGQQLLPTRYADPDAQRQLMQKGMSIADYLLQPSGYKAPTSAERLAYMKNYAKEISDAAGPSASGDIRAYIKEQREALGKEREEAKGLAALQAIPAILQPGGLIRGLGGAAASIGSSMAKANAAQRAAKNQFAMMEFNLADADRKERMGLHRDARAAFDESEKNKLAGIKADREAKAAAGNVVSKLAQANRVTSAGAGAGGAKMPQVDRQAAAISDQIAALESSNPNDPKLPLLRKQLEGRLKIISTGKDVGPQRAELMAGQIFSRASESVQKTVRSQALMDDEWRNAMANGDSAGMAAALDRLTTAQMNRQGVKPPGGGGGAPTAKAPPPPPGFNPVQ